MDIVPILIALIAFVAFDIAAMTFGADTREPLPDDHQR
jgi:hypothetical protein